MIQDKQVQNSSVYELKVKGKETPHLIYTPEPYADNEWYHPLLGYPMCPLIGRYNKGQYRIGDVVQHLEFVCEYDEAEGYRCGNRKVSIPDFIVYQLRHIPQVITYNKPKNLKNEPDVHLTHHLPQKHIKLNWMISFGQIGKDFLNYLNHCYIFDQSVFYGDKLNRTTCNIPIIAYMPPHSGLEETQVQRGISMTEWRSQYMSIHLKGGAPAFSPNNMRLGVHGVKKAEDRQKNNKKNTKDKKGKKIEYKQKQQPKVQVLKVDDPDQEFQNNEDFWKQIQSMDNEDKNIKNKPKQSEIKEQSSQSHKFVHFYTAVLLENDHRVNYHWHIDDPKLENLLREVLKNAASVQDFVQMYRGVLGEDALIGELGRLLML